MIFVPTATGQLVEASFFDFALVVLRLCNSLIAGQDVLNFHPFVVWCSAALLHSSVWCFAILLHSYVGCAAILLHFRAGCLAILLHSSAGCLANVYPEPPPAVASPLLFSERMSVFRDGTLKCKNAQKSFITKLFGDICGVFVSECGPFLRLIILRSPGAGEDEANGRRRKRRQAEGMCDPQASS